MPVRRDAVGKDLARDRLETPGIGEYMGQDPHRYAIATRVEVARSIFLLHVWGPRLMAFVPGLGRAFGRSAAAALVDQPEG